MTAYYGDLNPGDIIDIKFTTVRDTGAPFTLAGTPAVSIYKDNSTTQSTSGVTLSVDFDSVTGLHNLRVDTASDGTFYSAGSNFQSVITAGTVNSVSVVGYVVGSFSLQARSALRPTVASRTLDVTAAGTAGIDWNNVESPGTTVALAGTTLNQTALADAVLDEVVEGTVTLRQSIRLANSANAGKLSGAATTAVAIRDLADSKNRVAATVDADGNRTAVTVDLA